MKKVLVFLFLLIPFSAKADLFTITLSQGTNTTTQGFTSVMDIFDQFENGTLNTILAGYDTTADADAFLDFRGIRMGHVLLLYCADSFKHLFPKRFGNRQNESGVFA